MAPSYTCAQELELREIHMKTASAKAAFRLHPGASDGVLVHPEWLQAHLSDPHVRVGRPRDGSRPGARSAAALAPREARGAANRVLEHVGAGPSL